MKLSDLLKSPSSFRAQMVSFIALMLALTMAVISLLNQRLEDRTTRVVDEYNQENQRLEERTYRVIDEYIHEIPPAIDLVLRSLDKGEYLYNLVNREDQNSPAINSESIIRHIFIVNDDDKRIFDSTNREDVRKKYTLDDEASMSSLGELKDYIGKATGKEYHIINFPMKTSVAKREVYIVLSLKRLQQVKEVTDRYRFTALKRLQQVKEETERYRLIAFAVLGLLVIAAIAIFIKRITRPITELGGAAEKVAEGNLEFSVPVSGPNEMRALSQTFNEMLSGLRSKRNLEELLQRAERSAVVGRLASGIAHEIRNPLNFINLSIDHLRASFAPKDEAPRAQYIHMLTTIKDELARLNRLVSDFLGYGRPAKLKIRELDARTLIEEVRDLVHTQAEQQGVTVNIEQNGHGDAKLQGDAELIKTCFSNLMINAIQAMPSGGALNVSLRPDNGFLEIKFADTGVGIMPEDMAQIFEPYYSTKDTGIGLGLPLTKKIIEEHGGKINVESGLGRGTTFTVTLLREP
jgi:signal transduction histidine kinase